MPEKFRFPELFKTPEEEIKEKPPIFKFSKKEIDPETKEEIEKEYVSVMGVELEVNKEGKGSQFTEKDFEGFALDKKSLELLKTLAVTKKLGQFPLIEGETDIGKSMALEYLCYLTNDYLIYQSFSGQTDVSEMIGKFVPAAGTARKKFEQLLAPLVVREKGERIVRGKEKPLSEESKKIIKRANLEFRGLTEEESKRIALDLGWSWEEIEKMQWIWSPGTMPRAMEFDHGKGCVLYADELGGAEPHILMRWNQVLAGITGRIPRLSIPENSEAPEIIAAYPEGHPQAGQRNRFWCAATTNPPSYAGREPFEKDFIRRWTYQRSGKLDDETFLARLDFVGHKRKPEIPEIRYYLPAEKPIDLEKAPELDHLLNLLITEFRSQAQAKLDSWGWEQGEQEFRFDEMSDALRAQKYLREMQGPDLLETLKEAIRFYYMGKIEANMQFYFKLSSEEFEKQQSERLKELETLMNELLEGPTAIQIENKPIAQKIKEEIEKLDPEKKRKVFIEKLEEIQKEKIYILPEKERIWVDFKKEAEELEKVIEEIQNLEKEGRAHVDPEQGAKLLEQAFNLYQKALTESKLLEEKVKEREDLEREIEEKKKN
jgi:MoxR-like ATPase